MAEKSEKRKKTTKPTINFADLQFGDAPKPLPKGAMPLYPIHEAVLNTWGGDKTAVAVKTPPDTAAFLSQFRAALRKNGHKVRICQRVENGQMLLWAEEPKPRKARKKKSEQGIAA